MFEKVVDYVDHVPYVYQFIPVRIPTLKIGYGEKVVAGVERNTVVHIRYLHLTAVRRGVGNLRQSKYPAVGSGIVEGYPAGSGIGGI